MKYIANFRIMEIPLSTLCRKNQKPTNLSKVFVTCSDDHLLWQFIIQETDMK